MKTSTRLAVAAAACGVVLLTACSPMKAGAAAIVGDQRISVAEVEDSVREVQKALQAVPQAQQQLPRPVPQSVLLQLVETNRYAQLAESQKVRVTDGEIDAFITNQSGGNPRQIEQALLVQGVPPSQSRDYVRAFLTGQKLIVEMGGGTDDASLQRGQQALVQEIQKVPVTFNPRYGRWDQQQGTFLATERFGKAPQPQQGGPEQGMPQQGGPQQGGPEGQMPQDG
ncbi:SurA N-terminal domain-containing protein [Spongiactinospora sp. 9N601]|uniref:SurA N-terminal domain-containing protein n=1 Tax=Spongiactinospora sp. 9N601 TaxID=3375149 RepID=UPI00379C4D6D